MVAKNSCSFVQPAKATLSLVCLLAYLNIAAQTTPSGFDSQQKTQIDGWHSAYLSGKSTSAFATFMDSTSAVVNGHLARKDYESVSNVYQYCIQLAKDHNDEKLHLKFVLLWGNFFKIKGDFQRSNEILLSALDKNGLDYDKAQQYLHISSNYQQKNR